jgi:hypothetical protein
VTRLVEFVCELVREITGWIVSFNDLIFMSCGLDQVQVVGTDECGDCHGPVSTLEDGERSSWWDLPWFRDLAHGLECCANGRWT